MSSDAATRSPPSNPRLEEALLGELLNHGSVEEVRAQLGDTGAAFYEPFHGQVYQAVVSLHKAGRPVDGDTVRGELNGHLRGPQPALFFDLITAGGLARDAGPHAAEVARLFKQRTLLTALDRARDRIDRDPDATLDAIEALTRTAAPLRPAAALEALSVPIDVELAADDAETYDWAVPGLLERGDRILVTGAEGRGKSHLFRQIGVQAASGVHPFTLEAMPAIRVLLVDVENPKRLFRREMRPLVVQAGRRLAPERLRIARRLEGLDLGGAADQRWLDAVIEQARPDLVLIGPLYKLSAGDPSDELAMKPVAMALDRMRTDYNFALMTETHSNKTRTNGVRSREPFGWSGWMRWPEFGYCITEDDEFAPWRGGRDERDWPTQLQRGGEWPFTVDGSLDRQRWNTLAAACVDAKTMLSERLLADATGMHRSAVHRLVLTHRSEWDRLASEVGGEPLPWL